MLFYRDQKGHEVDLIIESGSKMQLLEIKASATFHSDYLKTLDYLAKELPEKTEKFLVLGSAEKAYRYKDCTVCGYFSLDNI